MGKYYLFERNTPGRWIEDDEGDSDNSPEVDWYYWRKGARLPKTEIIPDPIKFSLEPLNPHSSDDSPHMPSYFRAAAPIFSDALIKALHACGVDNLDTYNVAIRDPDSGAVHSDYKAVNIIGLIAAVDMKKSKATVNANGPALIDVDFDGLAIDNGKAQHHLLFRLAESSNAIIAHECVRDYLLKQGFTDLAFYETEQVAL